MPLFQSPSSLQTPTSAGTGQPYPQRPQQYVNFQMNQAGPIRVVTPDRLKMSLKLIIIFGFLGIVAILAILYLGIGDLVNSIAGTFGASLSQQAMLMGTAGIVVLLAGFLIAYTAAIPGSSRYEFYPDRVVARISSGIALSTLIIPYTNITGISSNSKDAIANMLGTGTIVLALSGLDRPQIIVEGVADPAQTVADVQQALSAFTTLKVAEFEANAKIDRILSRE